MLYFESGSVFLTENPYPMLKYQNKSQLKLFGNPDSNKCTHDINQKITIVEDRHF